MKKKIVWVVVSCLMALSLVLASCGTAEVEEEEVVTEEEVTEEEVVEEEVVTPEEEVVVEEEVAPAPEVPKYGGVLNLGASSSPNALEQCYSPTGGYMGLWAEDLLGGDWTKGPAGTGEVTYKYMVLALPEMMSSRIAESFEMPDSETLVYHIRKGVRFHDKPPANGREVTADDVVYNMVRLWDTKRCPRSYHAAFNPWEINLVSIEATDEWTVVIKSLPGRASLVYEMTSDITKILPPEAIEQYGDMNDWENAVGTGPFMFEDLVPDSSATFIRNPNYWMKDPIGPGEGNQLPYLDGIKYIIMPDMSTRMAALRTAKVDHLSGMNWEDAARFKETKPELKYLRYLTSGYGLYMRVDKPELPFNDKRVRQALALAINNQEIADTFYGGEAEVYNWPVIPIKEYEAYFTPLEELPESTQELLGYHPDKAKQLLAEAGYPDGFKTEVILLSTEVDLLSIVKAYWADIGVDLKLDVKEGGVKTVVGYMKTHKEMFASTVQSLYSYAFLDTSSTQPYSNNSIVRDTRVDEAEHLARVNYFDWNERGRVVKEITPYLLDQAWIAVLPGDYEYTFWQPWLKNYHGENAIGAFDNGDWARWAWIDQDLKEEMTGRR